jgi:hypothetical protein
VLDPESASYGTGYIVCYIRQVVGSLLDCKAPTLDSPMNPGKKKKVILLDRAIFPYEPISGLNFTKFNFVC